MNSILQLKGRFESRKNAGKRGSARLPPNEKVSSEHLYELRAQLEDIHAYWKRDKRIGGALVSVHYTRVVPKSNRLRRLLTDGVKRPIETICGAKFAWNADRSRQWHVFTHFVSLDAIAMTMEYLGDVAAWIDRHCGGAITSEVTNLIDADGIADVRMAKTTFLEVVRDGHYIARFDIEKMTEDIQNDSIITIYQTAVETKVLLAQFGIRIVDDRIIDRTTLRLRPDEIRKLQTEAPYLIAMNVTDFTELTREDVQSQVAELPIIPPPKDEPVIGVIVTLFDEQVYQ